MVKKKKHFLGEVFFRNDGSGSTRVTFSSGRGFFSQLIGWLFALALLPGAAIGFLYIGTGSVQVSCESTTLGLVSSWNCVVEESSIFSLLLQRRVAVDVTRAELLDKRSSEGGRLVQPVLVSRGDQKTPILSGASNIRKSAQRRFVKDLQQDLRHPNRLPFKHGFSRWNFFGVIGLVWAFLSAYLMSRMLGQLVAPPHLVIEPRNRLVLFRHRPWQFWKKELRISDIKGFRAKHHEADSSIELVMVDNEIATFGRWYSIPSATIDSAVNQLSHLIGKDSLPANTEPWRILQTIASLAGTEKINFASIPIIIRKGSSGIRQIGIFLLVTVSGGLAWLVWDNWKNREYDLSLIFFWFFLTSVFVRMLFVKTYRVFHGWVDAQTEFGPLSWQWRESMQNYAGLLIEEVSPEGNSKDKRPRLGLILKHRFAKEKDIQLIPQRARGLKELRNQAEQAKDNLGVPLLPSTWTVSPNTTKTKRLETAQPASARAQSGQREIESSSDERRESALKLTDFSQFPPRVSMSRNGSAVCVAVVGVEDGMAIKTIASFFLLFSLGALSFGLVALSQQQIAGGLLSLLFGLLFSVVPIFLLSVVIWGKDILEINTTHIRRRGQLWGWKKEMGQLPLAEVNRLEIVRVRLASNFNDVIRIESTSAHLDFANNAPSASREWLYRFIYNELSQRTKQEIMNNSTSNLNRHNSA